jgi:ribonuclease HI
MYRKGRAGPEKILHFHLGTLERHTNYEAEAVGLLLAMWMLQNQHVMGRLNVSIYVDSQALLKAIKKGAVGPGQYLIEAVIRQAEKVNQVEDRSKLRVRWISTHSEVMGNERADAEAKRAAQGLSSLAHMLPPVLHNSIPHSATALKQDHLKGL